MPQRVKCWVIDPGSGWFAPLLSNYKYSPGIPLVNQLLIRLRDGKSAERWAQKTMTLEWEQTVHECENKPQVITHVPT